jgi:DNA-binding response OmpR family regulator
MEKDLANYDLLLLDVMMPGLSGFEFAERLKRDEKTAKIPIIFLTAKDTEDDALHGFGIGADDYVTKPFSVREVMARVKAVLSRSASPAKSRPTILEYEGLSVDLMKKTVSVDGNEVELTKTELELLCLFLSHRGQVFSRQELIEKVWPQNVVVTSRTIDVNITRMRKKIGRYAACIVARQGYGYLFEA